MNPFAWFLSLFGSAPVVVSSPPQPTNLTNNLAVNNPAQFIFNRAEGVFLFDAAVVATGAYSGHGDGVNNPALEHEPNVGPIPAGVYSIGPAKTPIDHLGPIALPLTPIGGQEMFGRSAFFIHGDNAAMDHTASDGCIILPRAAREYIAASDCKVLVVS